MYLHSANIKQIHHYTNTINSEQLKYNYAERESRPEITYLFPEANSYDSAETAKEKAKLDVFI